MDEEEKTKKELDNLPVIKNVDFGHTDPKITFPVGGEINLVAQREKVRFLCLV
jgi:muramoyltetrapeptide carboxypeptidase